MSLFDRLKGLFGKASDDGVPSTNGDAMISCHDALVLVHEFLDGELEDVPEQRVKAHFDMCQQCYPHLHLETAFRDAVRRAASGENAPAKLRARLIDLIAEADSEG